ncbi:MAG: bifunctional isocitrate dehydrogenase kinase/phosphatase [Oceanicoccus sp.]|uniref:bifunctional isocitrate dehydrogenase kinase/phosphatase n=1 Tax=Oceanicoccus sp. TaxID=2691044 RepID=UPI002618978E|nr:bifunctional isocitrate dehydrogenase kinase/phosphatase [Oceanicoccus sp.]MCP3906483.1 bifunctional isocitrate dehydrogenase kinase/phosphatase [Oceanicoccus sp.]MDG1772824.1 bifunctional isocitrate dehydrogenase kinase/phosphatase [Oceanicoccus sp.]
MGMSNAQGLAKAILNGFDAFFGDFQNVTLGAQTRFEKADWQLVHATMSHRLEMYKKKVRDVVGMAEGIVGSPLNDRFLWREAKAEYATLVETHSNYEIAQTFFNSVYCFVFAHEKVSDLHSFVVAPDLLPKSLNDEVIFTEYPVTDDLAAGVHAMLLDTCFSIPFENLDRDVERIVALIEKILPPRLDKNQQIKTQVLNSLFYRNKAAYLVGRIVTDNEMLPFVFPLLNNEQGGVYVDTVLFSPDDVSKLFSFTRSYFMVDASVPSQYVGFLQSIMPQKKLFELYSAIGFGKHAKTVFYRSAVTHTAKTDDQYVIAPGIKGMVMLVFTLPSYDYVYKVIKDRFTPPKDMTRQEVKDKYKLVKRWDRAGRMAETQEFNNLAFNRRRFSEELLAELHKEAPSLLESKGNALILNHVYVERRMTPLNLYLKDASEEEIYSVMDEYGNAIKQLAGANIFPGDMLLKNFGVTRHGRVVFYDYDEICPLVDCNFRAIPTPRTEEQEMASQPWYDVAPADVFPEEFRLFFSGNRRAREVFDELHPELYSADFWRNLQEQIKAGMVEDVFPYRRRYRFPRQGGL